MHARAHLEGAGNVERTEDVNRARQPAGVSTTLSRCVEHCQQVLRKGEGVFRVGRRVSDTVSTSVRNTPTPTLGGTLRQIGSFLG